MTSSSLGVTWFLAQTRRSCSLDCSALLPEDISENMNELMSVNEKLLVKESPKKEEDIINDWILRARRDKNFLKKLLEELTAIERFDIIYKVLSERASTNENGLKGSHAGYSKFNMSLYD